MKNVNFDSDGLLMGVIILISLMLICHITNYFFKKNQFADLTLTTPTSTDPLQYNKIYYDTQGGQSGNQWGKQSCSQLSQAQIPCDVVTSCMNPAPSPTPNQLSDSELAVLYKVAYQQAGIEVLNRTLKNK